jgi:hypothetical protein
MLAVLTPGDVVTVTRIDRLARSTFDLFGIVKRRSRRRQPSAARRATHEQRRSGDRFRLLQARNVLSLMSDDIAEKRARIEHMGLPEITQFMLKLEGNEVWFHYGVALSKRLYEISMHDNYVSDSERKSAAELLEIVKGTMERASPLNVEKYRLYLEANAYMEEQVHFLGVGSLAWMLKRGSKEYRINGETEIIAFLKRPEHQQLLENFFATLGPELAADLRMRLNDDQPEEEKRPAGRRWWRFGRR